VVALVVRNATWRRIDELPRSDTRRQRYLKRIAEPEESHDRSVMGLGSRQGRNRHRCNASGARRAQHRGGGVATALVDEGARVVLADINREGAERLAATLNINRDSPVVHAVEIDLRNEGEIVNL